MRNSTAASITTHWPSTEGTSEKKFVIVILREIEFIQIFFREVNETNKINTQLRFELDLTRISQCGDFSIFLPSRFHVKSKCQENSTL